MSNFRRPKNLTTRRMQETRLNPPKERSTSPRPAREIRWNCPVAAKCGGCQLTRLSYAEQLQWKQQRVTELLDGICEVRPILGMDDPFHYRNKVHAVLSVDKAGKPISGVYAMGTHRVVPVRHCLIEDRRADRIIQTIVAMLPAYKLRIYNEYTHRGFLRHILIRTGHVTGQIMVVLVATSLEFPGKKAFVQELIQRHPEITTVVLNCNQRETSMVLGTKEITLYGEGYMEDELCGKRFRISPQSFYQVNAKQCEVLYRTAIDAAHLTGAETLLDAYCGTGTIGLCASDGCKQLIGVELNADAIRDAKENARRNGVENARFLCDDAGRFMQKLAKEGNAPDVVMMDPPRAGSDQKFLQSLLMLKPKRVVYVSCNPETLARDLRVLVDGGYRAEWATPVDMFPGTEHVETVCTLSQSGTLKKDTCKEYAMDIIALEPLSDANIEGVRRIQRDDVSEAFVDTADTIIKLNQYGIDHYCKGHTYAIRRADEYIGVILIGEALAWESDPEEMKGVPFYRLMGFVIDKRYRSIGVGGYALEKAIEMVYHEFGVRPIALGVHRDNIGAERFYINHGFRKNAAMDGNDYYYLRYPENTI